MNIRLVSRCFAVASVALSLPGAGRAQTRLPQLTVADSAKVWSQSLNLSGERAVVLGQTPDSIRFRLYDPYYESWRERSLAADQITALRVLSGKHRSRVRMSLGAVIGAAVLGGAGAAIEFKNHSETCPGYACDKNFGKQLTRTRSTVVGGAVGAATGAILGGLIGSWPTAYWRRVYP